jgi:3',5'-cyclic AMP phosphodiesterase CpdA
VTGLQAAIASMDRLGIAPDAVLVSGDLVDHATDLEYEQVAGALGQIATPVHILPGNHDRRDMMRRHFKLAGEPDSPVQYSARRWVSYSHTTRRSRGCLPAICIAR